MRKGLVCGLVIAALMMTFTTGAPAQTAPSAATAPAAPATAPAWSDITEIVVRAHVAGPAMWRLTKGNSTVWVLGILAELPDGLSWNSGRLQRALKGANALIIPGGSVADDQAVEHWAKASLLPRGQHLKDVVSKADYARFAAEVRREKDFPLENYTGFRPVRAGKDLFEDTLQNHHISRYATIENVRELAGYAATPVKIAYQINGNLVTEQWLALDAVGNEACLDGFLDGIDYDLKVLPEISRAWAHGDLPTVLRDYKETALLTCDLSTPAWKDTYKTHFIDDMTASLDDALGTPGKSVAVVPLSDLLRKDGVLDQLRSEGVTISSPKG